MKTCFHHFAIFAALYFAFSSSLSAARINLFEQSLGSLPTGAWSTTVNDRANALLNDNDIDFGYFIGAKSTDYFQFASDDYVALKKQVGSAASGRMYFTYRPDRYEIVALAETEDCDSSYGGQDYFVAYLLRDKTSLREYLCIHAGGTQFSVASSSKINAYLKPLKDLVDRCQATHPNARLVIFHPGSAYFAKTYSALLSYCDDANYMDLNLLVSEETAGGIHSGTNVSVSVASHEVLSEKVYDTTDADYPLVATLVYPHDVVFTDDVGNAITNEVVNDGCAAVAPPNPTKSGFEFTGWSPSDFSNVTNDLTVVAQFQVSGNSHLVSYMSWDGGLLDTESVEDGALCNPPDVPSRLDYQFSSWTTNGAPFAIATPVKEDRLLQ